MAAATGHLERFLKAIYEIHSTGVALPETSYYPDIKRLLEDVGAQLSPKVRPVIHIRDQGSGIPDGGLFVVRPSGPVHSQDPMQASAPERGALEVKPPDRDLTTIVGSRQVRKYLERYGKVLVTTLRSWTLMVMVDGRGKRVETYTIAPSAAEFWALAAAPKEWARAHEEEFVGFLKRALEHDAPLASPQELAWILAAHARTALDRIEGKDVTALKQLRTALSESLGLTFKDKDGDHFFRSTLIQTLFYGIFSAWVLWHRADPTRTERFEWRTAAWHLRVPMVSILFEKIATRSTLSKLGIADILDWTEDVLARVDRPRFFSIFEEGKAVQYFYEPFLAYFDKWLRKQFGVWYTPAEVVDYMVERIDQTLKSEFRIEKGFADERVLVLDPCVGTGSYLLAVLKKIQENLPDDALASQDLKQAAMERIFGFEILPAPFVVAHLQIGLLLDQLGAPLSPSDEERAAIFLTNALTGWTEDVHASLPFPELEEEREAAHAVKHDQKILVVLGNPPYFPFAGVNSAEEADLIAPYKVGIKGKNSLGDLYVRFIRVAERRIVDGTGHGIVCFITHSSYLYEKSFVQMRRVLLDEFDSITIDNLNGDSRETGKRTPDGKPDPSIFSTPMNRPGIKVGTAIGLFVRDQAHTSDEATVRYREFWGEGKRAQLLDSLHEDTPDEGYARVQLSPFDRYSFRSGVVSLDYSSWPMLSELASLAPLPGLLEKRGGALIDPDKEALADRMKVYLDKERSIEDLKSTAAEPLTRDWTSFGAPTTRKRLLAAGGFYEAKIVPFLVGPADIQWAYVDATPYLWNRSRSDSLLPQAVKGARYLLTRNRAPRLDDGAPLLPASCLGEDHSLHKDAYFIPFVTQPIDAENSLFDSDPPKPNYSARSADYLGALGVDPDHESYAELIWRHALAVAYAPSYVTENAGGIAMDWPRIPLPRTLDALLKSADLGGLLADLLDPLRTVSPARLPAIVAPVRRVDGGAAQPELGHLEVRARWGYVQQDGTVMPGQGKVISRPFTEVESSALGAGSKAWGTACDVYLNEGTYWSCVPEPVWEFKIGGFQVLKKWLSYREYGDGNRRLLGRSLTRDEAREFGVLARRITAVVSLRDDLDANYTVVTADTWQWSGSPADGTEAEG
jgi:hypothetical protein